MLDIWMLLVYTIAGILPILSRKGVVIMPISAEFKKLQKGDVIEFCKKNKEAAKWLKTFANTPVEHRVYPRVPQVNPNGDVVLKADRSQEPMIVKELPSFVEIKLEFVKKFMPELVPTKKPKEKSFLDLINELK